MSNLRSWVFEPAELSGVRTYRMRLFRLIGGSRMASRLRPLLLRDQDKSVDVGGFVVTETVRPSGMTLPWHFHSNTNIALVVKGAFVESVGKQPENCDPYSLIIRPSGEAHYNEYSIESRCIIIEVKPERLEVIRQVTGILDRARHIRDGRISGFASRIHREFRAMDSASALSMEALTLEMLAHTSRQTELETASTGPGWLRQAKGFIGERFAEPLTLSSVADHVGVHAAHLARTFRRHFQCSVGEYVRGLRLEYVERELAHTDRTIADIALDAGFYDQSHLSHSFKLHSGMTPAGYRERVRM